MTVARVPNKSSIDKLLSSIKAFRVLHGIQLWGSNAWHTKLSKEAT